jgi:tetratricopeptide (TPR) repeat protein
VLTLAASGCSTGGQNGPTAAEAQEAADGAFRRGNYDSAIAHLDEAIRLDPRSARAYHGRGVAFFHKKEYDRAIASLTEAIGLEPENDGAFFDRGLARWHAGQAREAVADFTQATELNPRNDDAWGGLAWALATAPDTGLRDGKRAVDLAKKACELTAWKNPLHLSSLAAAHAECGDFTEALRWHRKAMESPDFPADKKDRAKQRLALYEQGKPHRENYARRQGERP